MQKYVQLFTFDKSNNSLKLFGCILVCLLICPVVSAFDSNTFRQEYKPTYGSGSTYRNFSPETSIKLTPKDDNRIHNQLRDFSQDPQSSPRYNSSCQFGVCLPGGPGQSKTAGN